MKPISHHVPDSMLAAYASGSLPMAYAVVVAAHVSLCFECRAALSAHQAVGGAVLDSTDAVDVSAGLKSDLMAMLDSPYEPEPKFSRSGIFPAPIVEAMQGRAPNWRRLGMGVKQDILSEGPDGSVRLLYIPPGQAVPDHSHGGTELTLVLQGSFSDETGQFGVGDLEVADEHLEHTPIADQGDACVCVAATDAPLKFRSFMPRLLQPIFRI